MNVGKEPGRSDILARKHAEFSGKSECRLRSLIIALLLTMQGSAISRTWDYITDVLYKSQSSFAMPCIAEIVFLCDEEAFDQQMLLIHGSLIVNEFEVQRLSETFSCIGDALLSASGNFHVRSPAEIGERPNPVQGSRKGHNMVSDIFATTSCQARVVAGRL